MRLISPVISSALLCGDTVCNTSSMQIEGEPVRIQLEHEKQVIMIVYHVLLLKLCLVLLEFIKFRANLRLLGVLVVRKLVYTRTCLTSIPSIVSEAGNLVGGQWNDRGCVKSSNSISTLTTCLCNHLTHFGILLSPRPETVRKELATKIAEVFFSYIAL